MPPWYWDPKPLDPWQCVEGNWELGSDTRYLPFLALVMRGRRGENGVLSLLLEEGESP